MHVRLRNIRSATLMLLFCALAYPGYSAVWDKMPGGAVSLDKSISGKVTGDDGKPLPGASILAKGSTIGTTTDGDGLYKLTVPNGTETIIVSFIGYVTRTVTLGNSSELNVTLSPDSQTLTDVVVVGYGVQKKSDLTGAISSVKGAELALLPVQRVDQALQGRAAGVMVMTTDGAPGGNVTIRVRGMNSITGGNGALIVIDGLQGGNLNSLNPNDIESMEVLKDASATAIYGSQGANGVILITTKMGKKGKPSIDYSYNIGVQKLRNKLDLMNAADFARTTNAFKATQNGSGVTPLPIFSDAQIQDFEKNGGTDWQDEIYRTAAIQNHQLSISGGADNIKYLVSAGYLDQKGILLNSSYKRYTLRANVEANITKWATFGLTWAGAKEGGNSPVYGNSNSDITWLGAPINTAPRWAPTTPVYNPDGSYSRAPTGYAAYDTWNPVASAKEPYINNNTFRNTLNAYLEFKLLEGLKLKVTGGALITNMSNRSYYNQNSLQGLQNNGYGIQGTSATSRYQNSNILTYDKTIGRHHFNITGVAEQQFERGDDASLIGTNFLADQTKIFDLGGAKTIVNSSNSYERVINSYLGRVNYSFADKYLFTASYRADGSSVFGANNKWGYFPSMSLAWRLSEETFIKDLNLFSDLKLRGSWGVTGNQAISPYQTFASVSSGSNYPYNGNDQTDIGFNISRAANPNLKWESTTQTNIGLDFGLFNGRLTSTIDYYVKTTKDLLLSRQLPAYTGFVNILDNVGSVENKGIEFAISGDPFVGDFKWNTGFNISANRNKVLDIGADSFLSFKTSQGGYTVGNIMYLKKGEPFGQMYGYGYDGTWKTSEAEKAAAYGQLPGDPKYTDVNGDGKIDNADFKVIGNAMPKFIYGWTNRLSYKNFDLTFLIQGVQGNNIFNMSRIRLENPAEATSIRNLDRWTPENQNTDIPAYIDQQTRLNAKLTNAVAIPSTQRNQLSRYVEDGSYLRLKNITLGYNVPKAVTNKLGLNRVRVYASGMNLLTFTKYTGYDPETSSFNSTDSRIGVDFGNYPTARTYSFGIDLSF
jgi:TonB-linked SusC/RagA family outer membrane protein